MFHQHFQLYCRKRNDVIHILHIDTELWGGVISRLPEGGINLLTKQKTVIVKEKFLIPF